MTVCPYEPMLEKQLLGDLPEADWKRLEEHVDKCIHCQNLFCEQHHLESLVVDHFDELESDLASTRSDLIGRIESQLRHDDELMTPRRFGRLNSRFLLYTVQLVGIVMIALTYVASMVSVMTLKRREQVRFTENEVRALLTVIRTYHKKKNALPETGNAALVKRLSETRKSGVVARPYFSFENSRLLNEVFLDSWNRPYVYRSDNQLRSFRIYSLGPNGRDEDGRGDDISASSP